MVILSNPSTSNLYRKAIEQGLSLSDKGALLAFSGKITGRCPLDKRIVLDQNTRDIWWGNVNRPISPELFQVYYEYAKDYYNNETGKGIQIDGCAGWNNSSSVRYPVSVYCVEAYHALFMKNMLVSSNALCDNDTPIFTIYNLGLVSLEDVPVTPQLKDESLRDTLVAIDLTKRIMLIYGTRYAGEMKKGILTWMMYQMTIENKLCLHSSANRNKGSYLDLSTDNVTLFFGMSGTGKTTLSSDPERILIGDDEHVWTDRGIFNIEGGCYAKCIDLKECHEPDIFRAVRYGSVLENVVVKGLENTPEFSDDSITKNTRCSYPLSYIPNSACSGEFAGLGGHPNQIVFLTCDAQGLLPPISLLSPNDAVDFFLAGYTSKMAGTEMGVTEPVTTFSACFGEPFLIWHPEKYGSLLKEKITRHNTPVWLVNTGWSKWNGGVRIPLRYTRQMIKFINNYTSDKLCLSTSFVDYSTVCDSLFCFQIPKHQLLDGIPESLLFPDKNWDKTEYKNSLARLHRLFVKNRQDKLKVTSDKQ